ncbi:dTMP kinase [Trueperella pyogenes]|uniref:dTMP kinase n=2 Tax=Actinomycetales TaxID=2037 RepID=A0ABT9PJD6_9ACTO|nr:dTMP kinase [Trueperella abortisuis]
MEGRIIVFEGIYSLGKSTQIRNLSAELARRGIEHVCTSWNSSALLSEWMLEQRIAGRLHGSVLTLLELADFAERWFGQIEPLWRSGVHVIADRYLYTAVARGLVRGVEWDQTVIQGLLALGPRPDLTFLFQAAPQVSLERRLRTERSMQGYVSGSDFLNTGTVEENYVEYQSRIAETYGLLVQDAVCIDASCSQSQVWERVKQESLRILDPDV